MQPINTITAIIRKIKAYFLSYFDDERGGDSYINEPSLATPSHSYTDGDDCVVLIEDGTTHPHVPISTTILAAALETERVTMDEFIRGRPSTLEDFRTAREEYVIATHAPVVADISISATEPFTMTSSSPPTPLPTDGPTDDIFIVSPTPSMETNAMINNEQSSRALYEDQGTFTLPQDYIPTSSEEPRMSLADIEAIHTVFVNATYGSFASVARERYLSMDDTQREEIMNPMTPPRKTPPPGETSPTDSLKTPDTPENDIPWATADALRKN